MLVDLVSPPIITAADLIAKHSALPNSKSDRKCQKAVKYNRSQSAVLAARVLCLTKATFSPLEKLPDLSNSAAVCYTIDSFVALTNKITTCLNQNNGSKWYKRAFA
ncbi:hypothetical protein P9112_000199 [Eukaryota sp. TZLM1-RC]